MTGLDKEFGFLFFLESGPQSNSRQIDVAKLSCIVKETMNSLKNRMIENICKLYI